LFYSGYRGRLVHKVHHSFFNAIIHFVREGRDRNDGDARDLLHPHHLLQQPVAFIPIHYRHLDVHEYHLQSFLTTAGLLLVILCDLVDAVFSILSFNAFLPFIQLLDKFCQDESVHVHIVHNHYLHTVAVPKVDPLLLSFTDRGSLFTMIPFMGLRLLVEQCFVKTAIGFNFFFHVFLLVFPRFNC